MKQKLVIMGVSGCGKSTIGKMLATELGGAFYDGDDFHPQANIDKMASGTPLNDDDRKPWLEALVSKISEGTAGSVTACSALKKSYRDILRTAGDVTFVYLYGSKEMLLARLTERSSATGHFMPVELLDSQLNTLENPIGEEDVLAISIEDSPEQIISHIVTLTSGR